MGILASNDFFGRTMVGFEGALDKKIEALTVAEVNAAFKNLVKAEDLVIVKAGDFKKAPPASTDGAK